MKFKNLICSLLLSLNVANGLALDKKGIIGDYSYFYTDEKSNYLQLDDKESGFSLRILDTNSDNKTNSIRLLDEKQDINLQRKIFTLENSVKEVQLFDLADQFLKYFSNEPKKQNPKQIEKYNNYLKLIKERFLKNKKTGQKSVRYNFNKFFMEEFKPQDSIEDLIVYTYFKYNKLVRETKTLNPEQTFQSLIENAGIIDQLRFWWLFYNDYGRNLNRLEYGFENFSFNNDYLEMGVLDKTKQKKDLPYLKIEVSTDSLPDSLNINEIKDFLEGDNIYMFKYDEKGNYLYGGFKCNK